MEELIAELTSSFLCADLQIQSEPWVDRAPYLSSWLKVMKDDKRAIFTAAKLKRRLHISKPSPDLLKNAPRKRRFSS
jgi:antirestriction protein ArdC